jgi:hypothetical protein
MTTAEFVQAVERLPLQPEQREQLATLMQQFPDVDALAAELVRRGWLTNAQVEQIVGPAGNVAYSAVPPVPAPPPYPAANRGMPPPMPPARRSPWLIVGIVVGSLAMIGCCSVSMLGYFATGKVEVKVKEQRNRHEIALLDMATTNFMAEYQLRYPPPSSIVLDETGVYAGKNTVGSPDYLSYNYITKMFPRINFSGGIDWNGDGEKGGKWVLEGHEAIVFFLGGIPSKADPPTCRGFSANPRDPADFTGTGIKPPMFEFDSARLVRSNNNPKSGGRFLTYLDTYSKRASTDFTLSSATGQPYAYFSSGPNFNGYNPQDCALLGLKGPYMQPGSPPVYWKPDSFQIISAGADHVFFPGGVAWGVGNRVNADDQTNFAPSPLSQP